MLIRFRQCHIRGRKLSQCIMCQHPSSDHKELSTISIGGRVQWESFAREAGDASGHSRHSKFLSEGSFDS